MNDLQYKFFGTIINNINIEILQHGYLTGDSQWKYHNVNSPFNRLYFILDGFGYIQNKQERIDLIPGNIYLIPLQTTYNYICDNHLDMFYLHFKSEILPGNDIFNDINACLTLPFDIDNVNKLIKMAGSSNISDIAWCKAVFIDVIFSFVKPHANNIDIQVRSISKYQKLFYYIKANSPAKVTINQLAAQMNMSVSSLSRSFKLDTGITIKEYIKKQILQSAKEVLLLEDLSIKQVAYQLGFNDEFYFSRFFKKETGLSPKDYKNYNRMEYNL